MLTPSIAQIRQKEREEIEKRKTTIHALLKKFSKHRGWKQAFLSTNPMFDNNAGITMITNAHTGKVSSPLFLKALETFNEFVQNEQPAWYKITQ
jgi:inorganic pyrophosphatase/exopolyphosphatase